MAADGLEPLLAKPTPGTSQLALCMNLITATLGCGILSLPWATAGASLVPAAVITLLVLMVNAGTNMILVFAAEAHGTFDLGGLLGCLPRGGKVLQAVCEATIWLTVFMCLVGYLIVVADSCQLLLPGMPRTSRVAVSAMIVFPLCFMDQSRLAFSSSLSIAANVYVCLLLVALYLSGWRKPAMSFAEHECCLLGFGKGDVTMISALMQAAVVQMCILPMYEQMEQRSPRKFAICLGYSFSFVALLFVTFSCVAYFVLGPKVSSNVLLDLPPGPFGDLARVAMAVAVVGVYPILLSSMVAPIKHREDHEASHRHCKMGSASQRATVGIVAGSAVVASLTSNLGQVNVISGASQVAVFVAAAPGLTGLFLLKGGATWRACMLMMMAAGVMVSIAGVAYTDNFVGELQDTCHWATPRAVG
ncbi:unnamed protein product [Effrenium voratum]|nr:unnamed protein product [Effrenium voratum]